jgi:hypothetical protein
MENGLPGDGERCRGRPGGEIDGADGRPSSGLGARRGCCSGMREGGAGGRAGEVGGRGGRGRTGRQGRLANGTSEPPGWLGGAKRARRWDGRPSGRGGRAREGAAGLGVGEGAAGGAAACEMEEPGPRRHAGWRRVGYREQAAAVVEMGGKRMKWRKEMVNGIKYLGAKIHGAELSATSAHQVSYARRQFNWRLHVRPRRQF